MASTTLSSVPPSIIEDMPMVESPPILSQRNSHDEVEDHMNNNISTQPQSSSHYLNYDAMPNNFAAFELPTFTDHDHDNDDNTTHTKTVTDGSSTTTSDRFTEEHALNNNTIHTNLHAHDDIHEHLVPISQPPPSHPLPPTNTNTFSSTTFPISMDGTPLTSSLPAIPPMSPRRRSYMVESVRGEMDASQSQSQLQPPAPPLVSEKRRGSSTEKHIVHQNQHHKSPSDASNFSIGNYPTEAILYGKLHSGNGGASS